MIGDSVFIGLGDLVVFVLRDIHLVGYIILLAAVFGLCVWCY